MKLSTVLTTSINLGERRREDYGDIEELARSIKEKELINPIAVYSPDGKPPFLLAAGGRRFLACVSLGMEKIPCRIYDHPLSELELKEIELEENTKRKDLRFDEEARLSRDIRDVKEALYGKKTTSVGDSGTSLRDIADSLGRSHSSMSGDIKLADTMDAFPDMGWDKCKNKAEAMKIVSRIEEGIIRSEISKRAKDIEGDSTTKKMIDSYIVGDFFDQVSKVPDGVFDVVEIDTPYGIDLPQKKLHSGGGSSGGNKFKINYGSSYNEIDASQFEFFMAGVLKELYRVMNDHSWLIWWFGPEPWFDKVYHSIIYAGFKTRRIPGIWKKNGGQTNHPDIYMASAYEMFYYAYKGDAVINLDKRGRSNVFDFPTVFPSKKIHPTERPRELTTELLSVFGFEGARVYVPFCGSGNTLRSAFDLKMYPVGVELSQSYKDGYVTRIVTEKEA